MSDFINLISNKLKQHYIDSEYKDYPKSENKYSSSYLDNFKEARINIINDLLVDENNNNWLSFEKYAYLVPCTKMEFYKFLEEKEDFQKIIQWKNNIVNLEDI